MLITVGPNNPVEVKAVREVLPMYFSDTIVNIDLVIGTEIKKIILLSREITAYCPTTSEEKKILANITSMLYNNVMQKRVTKTGSE